MEYFYLDHLGSIRMVTNSAGETLAKIDYDTWGRNSVTSYNGYDGSRTVSYTGKKQDLTGLYYFNARYYDPTIGRFLSEDPLGDGMNWYSYCGSNPITFTDPTGLDAMEYYNSLGKSDSTYISYDNALMNSLGSGAYDTSTPSDSPYPSAPPRVPKESDYLFPIGPKTKDYFHCDQMAAYQVFKNRRDSRNDRGNPINFDEDNVPAISRQFDIKSKFLEPPNDSGGFLFMYPDGNGGFKHLESYENTATGLTVWQTDGLIIDPPIETPMDAANLLPQYRDAIWVPRAMR